MKRLVSTSVGWIEIDFAEDQRFASLFRLDESGWAEHQFEWNDFDNDLATAIEGLGVPSEEAQALATQSEAEWLRRGGVPQSPSPWWEGPAFAAILLATLGVWLAGVGLLIWLLVGFVG
jgi:hypothetical protein